MKYKKIMALAIFLVSLLAISAVSAADNATGNIVSVEETTDDIISVENDNQISGSVDYGIDYLSAGADGSFTDLANEIANANGELNLTRDYVFSAAQSKYINGIVINKQITIDGKGFSINGNNNARAFEVSSSNVILKNINFIDCDSSSSGGAIYWKGASGKLINCSFTDCHSSISNSKSPDTVYNPSCSLTASGSSYGGAIYWSGTSGSISECDFKNCYCSATNYVHATANSRDYSKDPFRGTSSTTSSTTDSSSYGGAIYWAGTSGSISDCDFIDCYSKSYGASYSSSTFTHYTEMGNTYSTKEYSAYCSSYSACSSYSSIYWVGSTGNLINCNFKNPTPSYGSDSESNKDSRSYVKATSESSSSTYGGAIYWGGTSGSISDCNFIKTSSSSYYKDAVYWKGNGNQFNCSFNGNYYDYSKYCGKYKASVYPIMLIHKSTLDDDGRIVIFESTQLVKNITVTLYDITDTKILYDQFDISSEDLTSSLNLNNLKEGKYQIELQYDGDAFYSATSTNAQFNIGKNSSFEVLIPENIVEGDATTINLTLNGDASGKVKLTLSNYTFINELIEGKTSFNIPSVSGGINTYQIKYIGDNKYNPIYINDTFNVLFKSDINLDLEDKYIFGENIPLTYIITPNCTGIIRIYVDNVFKSNITVNDVFELKNINAGNHNVTFIYNGDEYFSSSSTYSLLTVLKADPTIKVNSSNLPGTLSFDIILNETATGNISINFDNKIHSGSIINGKTNIIVPNVNAGDYSVNVNYTGDNNYNTKSYDIQLTINKISTSVSGTIDNIIYSQEAIVNVKGTVDGVAVVKIDENFIENINIIANTITPVTFEGLSAGKHNVTITLKPSNTNYEESTYNTDFTVNKKDTTVKLGVENSIYGKEVIVNVTASNDGKVIVTIGDITKEKNVFANILTKINMGVLVADSYDVVASFDAGNNYKTSNDNDNIVISPAEAQITEIQTANNTYGEKTIIKVKTDVVGTLNIKVASTEKSFYVNANKLTSLDLGILDAGLQNVEIILDAGRNYIKPEKNTQVYIAPKSTSVNVNVKNCIYGENVIVKVTASENGKVTVKLGDAVKYVNVNANMLTSVDFGILNVKSYSVDVSFDGGNNYVKSYDTASLTVSPAQSKIIDIQKQDYVYGDNVIIKVKTNVGGKLIATIGDNTKNINIVGNQLTSIDFGIVNANNYDVKISLNAGDNYISSQNTTKITIKPKNTAVTLNVKEYNVKEHVVVNVTASENGKVTLKLNNNIIKNIDLNANKVMSVDFGALNIGSYDVTANFVAGNNYINSSASTVIIVSKLKDVNIVVPPLDKPSEDGSINIKLPSDAKGIVTLTINNKDYNFAVVDGVANVVVPNLNNGNYPYKITYSGDNIYPSYITNGNLKINHPDNIITNNVTAVVDGVSYPAEVVDGKVVIKTNKAEPKKSSEFTDIVVNDNQFVSIVLKDEDGKVIAKSPISYTVNGIAKTTTTGTDGSFVISDINGATITVKYNGNDKIIGTNTKFKFTDMAISTAVKLATHFTIPNRVITINGYAVDGPAGEQGIYYSTTLVDERGKPLSNVYIEFAVNNKIYNRTTDNTGSFEPYKLNMVRAGRYTMAFNFAGNDNYTNSFACVCVDLDKKPITIKASAKSYNAATKIKKYTVTLSTIVGSSRDGKTYLSPRHVTLDVNGVTYTGKTNNNGQVTFKITNLSKKGKYEAKVSYEGDKTYEAATKKVKLTIK